MDLQLLFNESITPIPKNASNIAISWYLETLRSSTAKVTSLAILLFLSIVGNVFLILTFASLKNGHRKMIIYRLIAVVSMSSLFTGITNISLQIPTIIYGRWSFSSSLCQAQGYFGSLFLFLTVWWFAILSLERYTKFLNPLEYPHLFSWLNTKIMLIGTFFLAVTQVTGPVYGWGEYAYIDESAMCSLNSTSKNVTTYIGFSLFICGVVPYCMIMYCIVLLLFKTRNTNDLPYASHNGCRTSFVEDRSLTRTIALSAFIAFILFWPAAITEIFTCCNFHVSELIIFITTCMKNANTANISTIFWLTRRELRNDCWEMVSKRWSCHRKLESSSTASESLTKDNLSICDEVKDRNPYESAV